MSLPPAFLRDPYPFYQQLRSLGPVVPGPDGRLIVSGHAQADAVLRNRQFVVKDLWVHDLAAHLETSPFARIEAKMLLNRDPPHHTRLRGLVNLAFTPKLIAGLAPTIQRTTDALIDAVASRGEIDVIRDFAYPLPITIIAEMLGVPTADRDRFQAWSKGVTGSVAELRFAAAGGAIPADLLARADRCMQEFIDYFDDLIDERRAARRDDLLSDLVAAEEGGERLSSDEVVATAVMLLIAGHETTMNLIGNGLLALLGRPDQRELLTHDASVAEGAIEELLRFDSPVQMTIRVASADLQLGTMPVRAGSEVFVLLGAANRDPARYPEPDTLDLLRADARPLSFGAGIHYCLGAALARLEGRIALPTLLRRLPGLRLTDGMTASDLAWSQNPSLRGVEALPVRFDVG